MTQRTQNSTSKGSRVYLAKFSLFVDEEAKDQRREAACPASLGELESLPPVLDLDGSETGTLRAEGGGTAEKHPVFGPCCPLVAFIS